MNANTNRKALRRLACKALVWAVDLIIRTRLYRWLSAAEQSELAVIFDIDGSSHEHLSPSFRFWCKVRRAAKCM